MTTSTSAASDTGRPTTASAAATCLGCGYALRGLTEPRCPECGLVFDPANTDTMDTPGGANRRLHAAIHWAPLPCGSRRSS